MPQVKKAQSTPIFTPEQESGPRYARENDKKEAGDSSKVSPLPSSDETNVPSTALNAVFLPRPNEVINGGFRRQAGNEHTSE